MFVSWASLTFSWENSSSRSKSYKEGLPNYFMTGANTPGERPMFKSIIPSSGVSNWGTINVKGYFLSSILA